MAEGKLKKCMKKILLIARQAGMRDVAATISHSMDRRNNLNEIIDLLFPCASLLDKKLSEFN